MTKTKTKTHFFRYKKECHNCTRNAHLLVITKRFGVVCRKCYKKELDYLAELYNDLLSHCKIFTMIYSERELSYYLKDLDSILDGIKIVWEQIYGTYYGTRRTEFEQIYKNLAKNEKACPTTN